jgi:hypothetical protein
MPSDRHLLSALRWGWWASQAFAGHVPPLLLQQIQLTERLHRAC